MINWPRVRLNEACTLVTDGTHHSPHNVRSGRFRYITAKNIRRHGLDLTDITFVDEATHSEIYSRCPVERGDVLYIKDGATTGIAVVNPLDEPFSLLSSVALLKPRREFVDERYLKHWLNSPDTYSALTANMTGSAIKRLVLRQIREAEIPLAPRAEQTRIADKLDTLLARVDVCRGRLDCVQGILDRLRDSILSSAMDGQLTEDWRGESKRPFDWQAMKVGDVAMDLRYGTSKKCHYQDAGKPVLRIPNVGARGKLDSTDLKRSDFDEDEVDRLALQENDLLVIRSNGSVKLVGKIGIVTHAEAGMLFAGYLMRLRIDPMLANARFVMHCLASPRLRSLIEQTSKSTSGVNNLNAEELRNFPLALPSLDEQAEIVRRVENLFALADAIEAKWQAARDQVERLAPALLAKAFRGELVPQDHNDEPVSTMLARIRGEQGSATHPKSRGRRA